MITDRQRVELVLLPMMMLDVLLNGVDKPDHVDAKKANALLRAAAGEGLAGMMAKDQSKIMRRAKRTHQQVLQTYRRENAEVAKVGLLTFYLMQAVTDCDYLVLAPGSAMAAAMDLMIPALQPSAEIEKLNDSAKKAARKSLGFLQKLGLFEGVTVATTRTS
jgi:hypothetical protein